MPINLLLFLLPLGLLSLHPHHGALADPFAEGLMDPAEQPKFVEDVPEAMADGFKVSLTEDMVIMHTYPIEQETGLRDPDTGERLSTPVFGYGWSRDEASWPGPTLEVRRGIYSSVLWGNSLYVDDYPFTSLEGKSVVDTSLHWAYSLPGYEQYSIENDGIPTVVHVHGSRSEDGFDGNPEHFFSPGFRILGPKWQHKVYRYPNMQPATALWYHDHTLGITRLNNYAGLQGFYIIRDSRDTGRRDNPLGLPAGEYEKAYAIQDKFFKENGELFYPAYEGEPYYDDYITGEGANWDASKPTALAEFFGDFMVVNGKIWPRQRVRPRRYRLRLLNGCDSRFLSIQFRVAEWDGPTGQAIPYTLVGTDQGLLSRPIRDVRESLIETGARHDIVIDFSGLEGRRIIMTNNGGDSPFTGELPGEQIFEYTNVIMSFDVVINNSGDDSRRPSWNIRPDDLFAVDRIRRVGLFEGSDAFGRLQPLLGGEKFTNVIESFTWSEPTTEKPVLDTVEEWEIYNFSGDAHPMHLHLVGVYVVGRYPITYDSRADEDGFCDVTDPAELNGICLAEKESIQHNGPGGTGFKAYFPETSYAGYDQSDPITLGPEYASEVGGRKDVVTALPGEVVKIRARFELAGEYVWHCHVLSHEDHEMMRVFEVVKPNSY